MSGEHFEDCKRVKPYSTVNKVGLAERVWKETERLIQLNRSVKNK